MLLNAVQTTKKETRTKFFFLIKALCFSQSDNSWHAQYRIIFCCQFVNHIFIHKISQVYSFYLCLFEILHLSPIQMMKQKSIAVSPSVFQSLTHHALFYHLCIHPLVIVGVEWFLLPCANKHVKMLTTCSHRTRICVYVLTLLSVNYLYPIRNILEIKNDDQGSVFLQCLVQFLLCSSIFRLFYVCFDLFT